MRASACSRVPWRTAENATPSRPPGTVYRFFLPNDGMRTDLFAINTNPLTQTHAVIDGKAKAPYYCCTSTHRFNVMAIALTVTAKGQVTLRKEVLQHLGVRPGDKLSVDLLNDHRIALRLKPGKPVSTIFGLLEQSNTERLSIEEIGEASAAGWAGEE